MACNRRGSIKQVLRGVFFLTAAQFLLAFDALARAGGGGSESGGSDFGSSDFGGSDFGDHSSGGGSDIVNLIGFAVLLVFIAVAMFAQSRAAAAKRKQLSEQLALAAQKDPAWDEQTLLQRAQEVFFAFQKAWCDLDTAAMQTLITEQYYRRMVLELSVLTSLGRRSVMENVKILKLTPIDFTDDADDAKDQFTVGILAQAKDILLDTAADKNLFVDKKAFYEKWTFRREGGTWKLDRIRQGTEAAYRIEGPIADFASRNGFYYDPDFGWLMMPHQGAIFGGSRFGTSDINNHVIGYYRNKVVEFYTYIPSPGSETSANYVVAQAILPIARHDILVKKRTPSNWWKFPPAGLRAVSLEYPDFNEKFEVYAHPEDNIGTLELLTPNFMTKIYDLPFELNIEVIGSVLYLYTKKRDVSYDQMLEILSWAFDEMKM